MTQPLLELRDLRTEFRTASGPRTVIDGVSLTVTAGQTLVLLGESGSGKSLTALSILRLLPPGARQSGGEVWLAGENLTDLPEAAMRGVRGRRIGMIFQEPMTSLNPTLTVGYQIVEALRLHRKVSRAEARGHAVEVLRRVGVGAAERRLGQYPHQLSGGLRQRVMIAMAIACQPSLLIADEPTTALDVTIQAQILELLARLKNELGMSIVLITHDLGVVAEFCDEVVVMYAGRIAERASARALSANPRHPYTRGLLEAVPRLGARRGHLPTIPGVVPSPGARPQGCYFADRCPRALPLCRAETPPFAPVGEGHGVACWNPAP
jgi:oligopeptide/dipeptide ABC transporter ATP-binding protein